MIETHKCLSCQRDETEVPLVSIRFSHSPSWICSQCLPTLIHKTEELQEKLNNLAKN